MICILEDVSSYRPAGGWMTYTWVRDVSLRQNTTIETGGFRATMTPGGLDAEEEIQGTSNHRDPESNLSHGGPM